MAKILAIDDEILVQAMVREAGESLGHEVSTASSLGGGLKLAGQGVDVVLLDMVLPDGNGLEHLKDFTSLPSHPEIVVITGHGDKEAVARALHSGAWDYLVKPLRLGELRGMLEHVLSYHAGRQGQNCPGYFERGPIVGSSPSLEQALKSLAEAAQSNVNVLILGETGTGKELFARALYRNSARADKPFITVDCAALPETLVESHLFGHVRGAFTSADRAREGLLSAADKGTLFLDEVGDLPLSIQGTFLRALELKRFRPIGAINEQSGDFRIVAATHRNLEEMSRLDLFRRDLLFRLRGISIIVPPLRERREDIMELANTFTQRFCIHNNLPPKEITNGCGELLHSYSWPGNVRELVHAMERACITSGSEERLYASHLPVEMRIEVSRGRVKPDNGGVRPDGMESGTVLPPLKIWKNRSEEDYLRRLMGLCQGDVRQASGLAGLSRGHLYELLKKHGMSA